MVATDHVLPYFTRVPQPALAAVREGVHADVPRTTSSPTWRAGRCRACRGSSRRSASTSTRPRRRTNGQYFVSLVLDALPSNPDVWAKTALFLMYDENDGWFDHVPPPTAPAGTPGEYLTATPLARSSRAPSQTLEHHRPARTRRPRADARDLAVQPGRARRLGGLRPHLAAQARRGALRRRGPQRLAWRLATVGDLTSTLGAKPNTSVPALPSPPVPTIRPDHAEPGGDHGPGHPV